MVIKIKVKKTIFILSKQLLRLQLTLQSLCFDFYLIPLFSNSIVRTFFRQAKPNLQNINGAILYIYSVTNVFNDLSKPVVLNQGATSPLGALKSSRGG